MTSATTGRRRHPRAASPEATVTVSLGGGPPRAAYRRGEAFFRQGPMDNSVAVPQAQVTITGVRRNVGPGGEDAAALAGRAAFFPLTPVVFSHNADGNLTQDGRRTQERVSNWNGSALTSPPSQSAFRPDTRTPRPNSLTTDG